MAEKVPNRRAGLHFRVNDATDLARVMGEAADETLYQALCSGLPEVSDHNTMARDYLAAFARMGQFQESAKAAPDMPRSPRRRRAASNVASV
jgi:hypothetical protein